MISANTIDDILFDLERRSRQARIEGDMRLEVITEGIYYYIATGRCPTPFLVTIAEQGIASLVETINARWDGRGSYAGVIEILHEILQELTDDQG